MYESLRLPVSSEMLLQARPKVLHEMHALTARLADELWKILCSDIDTYSYVGLAVDTGIDRVKAEHIMIVVLYVERHEYILPPIYSTRHKAYDGYAMAKELMDCLSSNLGEERLLKLEILMVEGSTVNHVARVHCEGFLKTIYDRISLVGDNDLENIELGVNRLCRVSLLSCVGHTVVSVDLAPPRNFDFDLSVFAHLCSIGEISFP